MKPHLAQTLPFIDKPFVVPVGKQVYDSSNQGIPSLPDIASGELQGLLRVLVGEPR
jgi:hypothetical protein